MDILVGAFLTGGKKTVVVETPYLCIFYAQLLIHHHHRGCMKLVFSYLLAKDLLSLIRNTKRWYSIVPQMFLVPSPKKSHTDANPGFGEVISKATHCVYNHPSFHSKEKKSRFCCKKLYFIGLSLSNGRVRDSSGFHALNWAKAR